MDENADQEQEPERKPRMLEDVQPKPLAEQGQYVLPVGVPSDALAQPVIVKADSAEAAGENAGADADVAAEGAKGAETAPPQAPRQDDPAKSAGTLSAKQTVDGEALSPASVRAQTSRLKEKLALLLIKRAVEALEALPPGGVLTLVEVMTLVELAEKIQDMQLANHWTERLERAIERNPSLMQNVPGAPMLRKVGGAAAKVVKAGHVDERTRGGKLRGSAGKLAALGGGMDLPQG